MGNGISANEPLFSFFDQVINGNLQPHLFGDDDYRVIDASYEGFEEYDDEWTPYEIIMEGDEPTAYPKRYKSKEKLNELLKLIPVPPSDKALKYLIKTGWEARQIKERIAIFIRSSNDPGSFESYAKRNITILRLLADQLRDYVHTLGGVRIALFYCNTNHFVAYVLKYFIVDLIRFIQKVFGLEITSVEKLRIDLFEEKSEEIQLCRIIPFLLEQGVNKDAEVYLQKAVDFNNVIRQNDDLSIGQDLFRFYKSKYKGLSIGSRIDSFKMELEQWEKYIAINDRIEEIFGENFNDPDLQTALIPLLREEIRSLEQEDATEGIVSNELTFRTEYTAQHLNRIREGLLGKKLVKPISRSDFEYLFTEQPVTKKMKRLLWQGSRPTAHEFLRRAVYGSTNFDFKQVAHCILFSDNKLLDSNCKSTAAYKNEDLFWGMQI